MDAGFDRAEDARAVLIAGPTASGKSRAALRLAERVERRGRCVLIVNADSMQVYDALRILTARPDAAEEEMFPHRLYGHVAGERRYSVGAWLADLAPVLADCAARGALPILVGGTGLYFHALTRGLAPTPQIPQRIRETLAERLSQSGAAALHRELADRDPVTAAELKPTDPQRILRALEVLEATGEPLSQWRRERRTPPALAPDGLLSVVMEPDRGVLYERIDRRFDAMAEAGAIEEVRALLSRGIAPDMPVMKAIGVREFAAVLSGEANAAEAIARAKMQTRRYAKRQGTWFRNQFPTWPRIDGKGAFA